MTYLLLAEPENRSLIKAPSRAVANARSDMAKRGLSLLRGNNEEAAKRWLQNLGAQFELDETGRVCSVRLDHTQISDAGLLHLMGLTNLRGLELDGTQISDVGLAELKKALPNCTIN